MVNAEIVEPAVDGFLSELCDVVRVHEGADDQPGFYGGAVLVELLDQLDGLLCEALVAAMASRQRGRPGVLERIRPMGLRADPPGEAVRTEPVGPDVQGFPVGVALAGLRI